jgi:hypothetical protein
MKVYEMDNATLAEHDLQEALNQSKAILGGQVPRLLTTKPLIAANSLTHGLTGQTVFLFPEQLRNYLTLGLQYVEEFRPCSTSQAQLVQRIIDTEWRLNTAISLSMASQTSAMFDELEARAAADPTGAAPGPESGLEYARALAGSLRRQCEGPNTLEKLGRHETRLFRELRIMRIDYRTTPGGTIESRSEANWKPEEHAAYRWYRKLLDLATRLILAREELAAKCVVETESVATATEQSPTGEVLALKNTLRIVNPLTKKTLITLQECRESGILTELERTMFPLPKAA